MGIVPQDLNKAEDMPGNTSLMTIGLGLLLSQSATAAEVTIEQGVMSVSGQATLGIAVADGRALVDVTLTPGFGYFSSDKVEWTANVSVIHATFLGESQTALGLGVGMNYYVHVGTPHVYAGVHVETALAPVVSPGVGIQGGMLIGLNEHVALDIGLRPTYYIQAGILNLNAGAIGVRGFF